MSYDSCYEDWETAIALLKEARPFIEEVHERASDRHDSYGEFYQNEYDWEIMQKTEALMVKIDKALENFNDKG